jgi:exodeoxyribonuclease V gamma subunit
VARELIAFAHVARGAPAPPADWLALMRGAIAATVRPEGPEEETALGDCLAVLESVSGSLPAGLRTSFLVAAELVRARIREPRASGHRAPEGVTVASFVPMRALPFRVVFLVGLDERVFPSTEGPDALDLRAAGVGREGDVTPRQRDEYMFLETLLSARERLYLSYVARDEITGDGRDPSSVVLTLRDVLGGELADALTRPRPPLLRHADPAACAVIPAAARERQAAALGGTLRQAAGVIQLPPVADLRAALAPETWAALAPRLGWLAPDAASDPGRTRPTARRSLTLADLRRFLECPLQGSVRVLLPLRGEDEAAEDAETALREHENLEDVRAETTPLLREVLARALTAGGDDAALAGAYEASAAVKQLDGTLPSGLFGKALRLRHLTLLRCWRDGLAQALGGALPECLEPLWLGGAPEHRRDVTLEPAIRLQLPLAEGPTVVELGGMTERLATAGGEQVAVTLISSHHDDNIDRDFLRAWLTHLALAACGRGAGQPFRSFLIRPLKGHANYRIHTRVFSAISTEAARDYLAAVATEQLGAIHPYFLPCEAIFSWRNVARAKERGLRGNVLFLRDDHFTIFRSDGGPVPDPRLYPVPSEMEAAAIVARRYQPFFDAGTDPAESDRAAAPGRRKGKRP